MDEPEEETDKPTDRPTNPRIEREPDVDYSPPTAQPEGDVTDVDTAETIDVPSTVDEHDCTAEPCPVSTHCRSRYGSCGPGFIYCNIYSIWKNTCPPLDPNRPTRTPTSRPTRTPEPTAHPTNSTYIEPTLPPLGKPTLPTITEAVPFVPPTSFLATGGGFAESDEAASHDQDSDIEESKPEASDNDQSPINTFESPEFLDEWTTGRLTNDDVKAFTHLKRGLILPAVIALHFLLF